MTGWNRRADGRLAYGFDPAVQEFAKREVGGDAWKAVHGLGLGRDEAESIESALKAFMDRENERRSYPRTEFREMKDGSSYVRAELSPDVPLAGAPYPHNFHWPPTDALAEGGPDDGERIRIDPSWRAGRFIQRYGTKAPPPYRVGDRITWSPPESLMEIHHYELCEWIERWDPDDEDTPPVHRMPPYDVKEHNWIWVWKGVE